MNKNKLEVGQPVLVTVDPRQNNDQGVAAALVTKVTEVEDTADGKSEKEQRLNLRVFLDTGADLRTTNVRYQDKEPEADEETGEVERNVAFKAPR